MKRLFLSLAVSACAAVTAQASIQNYGVDVATNGTQTVVPFYSATGDGLELDGSAFFGIIPGQTITFTFNAASIFGPGPISAAELFIDAFDVDSGNTSEVRIQGILVGSLANTAAPSDIPVEAGPVGTHTTSAGDVDNTFFNLAAYLGDLATDSTFTISIKNTTAGIFFPGEEIRIDGINVQAEVVPEPATIAVWVMLAGAGAFGMKKKLVA